MGKPEASFDPVRFASLVDAHHPALYSFARRRLADQAAVEDVLADTFLVAWRRRDEIPDPPLPWLYGVCLRTISTHRRSGNRRARLLGRLSSQRGDTGRDPAEMLAERSEISRAFAKLSESDREALRLVAWDGLSSDDAAAVLDVTPGAFRVRLHRARRALEKHLESSGHEQVVVATTEQPQPGTAR